MLVRACTWFVLVLLGAKVVDAADQSPKPVSGKRSLGEQGGVQCLPCEGLFKNLEEAPDGKLLQKSQLQLRGEPKSGTGFMFDWAVGILQLTCKHLQGMYGLTSCRTEFTGEEQAVLTMTFEPSLAATGASCPCQRIRRVEISASFKGKHSFPVNKSCPWWHSYGLPAPHEGCWSAGGRPVENGLDLWACMEEASCEFADNRLQFAAIRDPRSVAVSTYFHVQRFSNLHPKHPALSLSLDQTVLVILPQVCHLTALRHILFEGPLSGRSELFWYEEAVEDPFDWHYRWASLAGLILPPLWIEGMVAKVVDGPGAKKFNPHPGGGEISTNRTWRNEVSPGIHAEIDSILRTWLPGVLLTRLHVAP
ncbi:unnamed protein product [Ectocarpus sp. 13 AM-2016]